MNQDNVFFVGCILCGLGIGLIILAIDSLNMARNQRAEAARDREATKRSEPAPWAEESAA